MFEPRYFTFASKTETGTVGEYLNVTGVRDIEKDVAAGNKTHAQAVNAHKTQADELKLGIPRVEKSLKKIDDKKSAEYAARKFEFENRKKRMVEHLRLAKLHAVIKDSL